MLFFAERLKQEREKENLTQEKLAQDLNLTTTTINNYEQGTTKPDIETLNQLANYFNISVDYLLGRTDQTNNIDSEVKEVLSKDPALLTFWQEISRREDLQLLFKQTRNLSPEAIYRVIEIIKTIEEEEQHTYGG